MLRRAVPPAVFSAVPVGGDSQPPGLTLKLPLRWLGPRHGCQIGFVNVKCLFLTNIKIRQFRICREDSTAVSLTVGWRPHTGSQTFKVFLV